MDPVSERLRLRHPQKIELSLAGHSIKVEIPEAQAAGEIEVTFPPDASPFTALILKKAKLRFDDTLRVLDGEISAGIDLGKFVHVANTTLRVFEDGRIGAARAAASSASVSTTCDAARS